MKLYNHNFIGHDVSNVVLPYHNSDSSEDFLVNLKKMPDDWYYKNKDFEYSINNFGHRSKNINDLDLDNYILFTGCSQTEGIGLELSKTYPFLVSQKLGCDYYNLGLATTGIDVLIHNLIVWNSVVKKLPKVLVIQWTANRYITTSDNINFIPRGIWSENSSVEKFLVAGEEDHFFKTRKILASKLVETIFKCLTIELRLSPTFVNIQNSGITYLSPIDWARDNTHFGINSNANIANAIYKEILNKQQTQ